MSQIEAPDDFADILCSISGLKEVLREINIEKFLVSAIANNLCESNIELVNDLKNKVKEMEEIQEFSISILEALRDGWKMCICCFHYLYIENDEAYFLLLVTFIPLG
uniref:Uncharacterized protein n=1 Tax=Acrobeloides nanus TaxID=290746 RepID=A0A914EF18_9BILA